MTKQYGFINTAKITTSKIYNASILDAWCLFFWLLFEDNGENTHSTNLIISTWCASFAWQQRPFFYRCPRDIPKTRPFLHDTYIKINRRRVLMMKGFTPHFYFFLVSLTFYPLFFPYLVVVVFFSVLDGDFLTPSWIIFIYTLFLTLTWRVKPIICFQKGNSFFLLLSRVLTSEKIKSATRKMYFSRYKSNALINGTIIYYRIFF